jgi:NifU-like protein involved in Fe-S cluster formation
VYSSTAWQHATKPQHRYEMSDADAVGHSRYPPCGDSFTIYLKLADETIQKASFQAKSCGPVVAMGSLGCGLLVGISVDQARKLSAFELDAELGGLPISKRHAILMFLDALNRALNS